MNGFRSMGLEVALPFGAPLDDVRALFDARDARFSRFLPSSELNRVNATSLGLTLVSEEFASMLAHGLDAARATDGLVTPSVGGAHFSPAPPVSSISLLGRGLLRTEPLELDLNGVLKGRTIDDALALVGSGWIAAGGGVAAADTVVVGLPGGDTVTLHGGGLATSSVTRQPRPADGSPRRRLVDPRTGRPTTSPWLHVTVAAPTCLQADVAANAALLLGHAGPAWLDERLLAGRFVHPDGRVVLNAAWQRRAPLPLAA